MDLTLDREDEAGNTRPLCECIYEYHGHMEGEGQCPYGPLATASHPDGVLRWTV